MTNKSASSGVLANSTHSAFGRRQLLVGLGATALASCGGGSGSGSATQVTLAARRQSPLLVPLPRPTPAVVGPGTISPDTFYRPEHGNNWQPALKAAFQAGATQGKDVVLDRAVYNCRQVPQPGYYPFQDFADFALFKVDGSLTVRSTLSTGSRIVRFANDGSPFQASDFVQLSDGYRARGGCLVMSSNSTTPGEDPGLRSFTCHGVLFDGSLRRSMGLAFFPEILDKELWQHNDRNGGNITLTGTPSAPCGFIGWGGEQVYTAAISGPEAARRVMSIDANCVFGDTGGSALNPNGITTRVERCLLRDSNIGVEGWTGENGGYFRARMRDCAGSAIQAGVPNTNPALGTFFRYTPASVPNPLGYLDVVLERSPGSFGSGLRGRIEAIDCCPQIGTSIVFQQGVRNVDLDLISVADTGRLDPGFFLLGGLAGTQATDDVLIRLAMRRTIAAASQGFSHRYGAGIYGSFGPNVAINVVESYLGPAVDSAEYAPIHDNRPRVFRS